MTTLGKHQGFINRLTWLGLTSLLEQISENDGIFNKLYHLYQPDTDMDDNICENLQDSKINIVMDLNKIQDKIFRLIKEILALM